MFAFSDCLKLKPLQFTKLYWSLLLLTLLSAISSNINVYYNKLSSSELHIYFNYSFLGKGM